MGSKAGSDEGKIKHYVKFQGREGLGQHYLEATKKHHQMPFLLNPVGYLAFLVCHPARCQNGIINPPKKLKALR